MSFESEFAVLERAIHRLGQEYEIFLHGTGHQKVPAASRQRVEQMVRRLSSQEMDSPADRYRLNSLMGRYSIESERWERAVRQKEEGARRHSGLVPVERAADVPPPNASRPASVKRDAVAPLDSLFDRYVSARRKRGEDVSRLSVEKFRDLLAQEREKLHAKTGRSDWDFDLSEEGGRVRLVARPAGKKE